MVIGIGIGMLISTTSRSRMGMTSSMGAALRMGIIVIATMIKIRIEHGYDGKSIDREEFVCQIVGEKVLVDYDFRKSFMSSLC